MPRALVFVWCLAPPKANLLPQLLPLHFAASATTLGCPRPLRRKGLPSDASVAERSRAFWGWKGISLPGAEPFAEDGHGPCMDGEGGGHRPWWSGGIDVDAKCLS